MARYNEILVGRFAQSIQKLFGIKGEVPVASLAGEIVVSHVLNSGRENRFLENWRTFGGQNTASAVAAQDSVIRFANPAGSNIVAVIESMTMFGSIAGGVVLEFAASGNNGNLLLPGTPASFDSRFSPPGTGNNGAACFITENNNIGQGNHVPYAVFQLLVNTMTNEIINYDQQEIQVLPGADLQLRSQFLNGSLTANFRWRERFLEEQERA